MWENDCIPLPLRESYFATTLILFMTYPAGGEDDFAPLLFPMVLGFLIICLIIIGIGVAIGLVALAILALLVGVGILTTSTLAALATRKPRTGVQLLFLQIGAAGGVSLGLVLTYLANIAFELDLPLSKGLLFGGLSGLCAGLSLAALFNFAWGKCLAYLLKRVRASPPAKAS